MIRKEAGLAGPFRWELLHGDGSERIFYRVTGQTGTVVLAWSPAAGHGFPTENDSYVYMGRHLHGKGIAVPQIYAHSRSEGLILMEDLGSFHLQDAVTAGGAPLHELYQRATELLVTMQVRAGADLDTTYCFDTALYDPGFVLKRELEYFYRSFLLPVLGLEISWDDVAEEFSQLARRAGGGDASRFFLHRDFQSRNLMLKRGRLYLIDFQGARLGPPQYDLAALLLDPYVELPEDLRDRLLADHSGQLDRLTGIPAGEFLDRYPHVALCRSMQVLGAFGFLAGTRKKAWFARYVVPAWRRLRQMLAEAPCSNYRVLAGVVQSQSDGSIAGAAARLEGGVRSGDGGTGEEPGC
jgi:hypothetical protein